MDKNWIIWSVRIFLLLICFDPQPALLQSMEFDPLSDLMGPYCQYIGCCNDRKDSCSQPITGTLCYCDEFCNRTVVHDCCPDYWYVCKGISSSTTVPPRTTIRNVPEESRACLHNNHVFGIDKVIKYNCNECRCVPTTNSLETICETNTCLIEPYIIDAVNADDHLNWKATNYSKFWGRTLSDGVQYRLGTLQPQKIVMRMHAVKRYYEPNDLPRHFDSIQHWPRFITEIQDQGWCGSSWAVSTAAVASDRYGILSRGKEQVQLSAQNIISCLPKSMSCTGGRLDRAWTFIRKYGLVDEQCFPYTASNQTTCWIKKSGSLLSANCAPPKYRDRIDRYKVGPAYRLGNETDIMFEIMRSGPVQATMKVYHDFFSYENGIYKHSDAARKNHEGYHSVRIVGWGEEFFANGYQKYWKVANSWGTDWGENGYFRIVRGVNECEIEDFVLGVWSEIDRRA